GILLATSQLENSDTYGSGTIGTTFYCSIGAFCASIVASTVLLVRMLTLIHRATRGLRAAAKKAETAMETFADLRSWGVLRRGEVGCLTHIAAGRGMVRALEFLVHNDANPSAVDSSGQTPLEIAEESGMREARDYLEALTTGGDGERTGSSCSLSSPLPEKLMKVRKVKSPRSSGRRKRCGGGDSEGGEEGDNLGSTQQAFGWKPLRKLGETAVRWASKSDTFLARRVRGRVGVDPQTAASALLPPGNATVTSAASSLREAPPSDAAAAVPLPLQPLALSIVCNERGCGETSFPLSSALHAEGQNDGSSRGRLSSTGGVLSPGTAPLDAAAAAAVAAAAGECRGGEGGDTAERRTTTPLIRHGAPDTMMLGEVLMSSDGHNLGGDDVGDTDLKRSPSFVGPDGRTSSHVEKRAVKDGGGGRGGAVGGAAKEGTSAGATEGEGGTGRHDGGLPARRDNGVRGRLGDGGTIPGSKTKKADGMERGAESVPSAPSPTGGMSSQRLSVTLPWPMPRGISSDDGERTSAAVDNRGGGSSSSRRFEGQLAATVAEAFSMSSDARRRISSFRDRVSTVNSGAAAADSGANTVYSPTQAVLNITWALRRLRPFGTPRERRVAFKGLRESSPVHIPHMYLLAFVDMAALGEIPRRTGDQFLGHGTKRPVTVCELMNRAKAAGEDPVVVYVSHRWLEPDFKNPDDHSKARFYQVCYSVQKLAKRMRRKPRDFYLWIDYACINQQNPTADRLALPFVLDSCDVMVYVEDDEYWDQALSRTEHFIFHKVRRLRSPASGANAYEEDVFSLSADGEKLTQRTFAETRARFSHNPAKGFLATETDRLYLWTLVLALEYEDSYTFTPSLPVKDETGFMKLLREAVFVANSSSVDPKKAAAEIVLRDAQVQADAAAAA
ncbi:unnamed protein product, partial [Pylaiella littoralis]